jgi:hypothetical protein
MYLPLIIAILAFLGLLLLPVLDHLPSSDIHAEGLRASLARIARWTKE